MQKKTFSTVFISKKEDRINPPSPSKKHNFNPPSSLRLRYIPSRSGDLDREATKLKIRVADPDFFLMSDPGFFLQPALIYPDNISIISIYIAKVKPNVRSAPVPISSRVRA